jgi:serine/threonine protein kinase
MAATTWRAPEALPRRLPKPYADYQLLEFIAAGGFGVVYEASSPRYPGQRLALKFLAPRDDALAPTVLTLFQEETRVGQVSRSQYLAGTRELLDLTRCAEPGWPARAVVMEFLEPSLAALIQSCRRSSTKLPVGLWLGWLQDLARGLEELHVRERLAHRDIKLSNLFFRLAGNRRYTGPASLHPDHARCAIGDFGLIARLGEVPAARPGQDGWKAPELFDGPAEGIVTQVLRALRGVIEEPPPWLFQLVDGATEPHPAPPPSGAGRPRADRLANPAEDVFAFGLVLLALATVVEGPPKWLIDLARDCTRPDPAQRPRTADLYRRLRPDWGDQERLIRESGYQPDQHAHFVGRQYVFDTFEEFAARRTDRGGVFLIEAAAGLGKTALLTEWLRRTGLSPGFYFRYRDGRVRASAMPEMIFRQLCSQFGVDRALPAGEHEYRAALEQLLRDIAHEKLSPSQRLLLFVDGLDEADDPTRAVQFLPHTALPRAVFWVVSSRPPAGPNDHLRGLRGEARVYPLDSQSEANLTDLAQYFRDRLAGRLAPGQDEQLARSAGGMFQLGKLFADAIRDGALTVGQALDRPAHWATLTPAQLYVAFYRESWERIERGLGNEERDRLSEFACLLAAAQTWVNEKQVREILSERGRHAWTPGQFDRVSKALRWLCERRRMESYGIAGYYLQLAHQTIREFLISEEHEGPARLDLEEMHAHVGECYCRQAEREGGWDRVDPYGRSYAVRHLLRAKDRRHLAQAAALLTRLDYLQATLGDEPPEDTPAVSNL